MQQYKTCPIHSYTYQAHGQERIFPTHVESIYSHVASTADEAATTGAALSVYHPRKHNSALVQLLDPTQRQSISVAAAHLYTHASALKRVDSKVPVALTNVYYTREYSRNSNRISIVSVVYIPYIPGTLVHKALVHTRVVIVV